jgi:hypothetical protein
MAIKKSDLYSSLWQSCDELRGGMDASQYKDYVLFMLFIKYISDKYGDSDDFAPPVTIPPGASFKDMVALKGKSDIGDTIRHVHRRTGSGLWEMACRRCRQSTETQTQLPPGSTPLASTSFIFSNLRQIYGQARRNSSMCDDVPSTPDRLSRSKVGDLDTRKARFFDLRSIHRHLPASPMSADPNNASIFAMSAPRPRRENGVAGVLVRQNFASARVRGEMPFAKSN